MKNVRTLPLISRIGHTFQYFLPFALIISLAMAILAVLSGCGPKAFTKGEYDDPTKTALLDDRFNEADMQQMAETIIQAMVACPSVKALPKPPVVMVEKVQNRTEEHIDTVSLTDKVRTALIKSSKFRFVNKEERETLKSEYEYAEKGNTSAETSKKKGKQIGVDYVLSGTLSANVQQVGSDKLVYYKLTMNMTNVESSIIDCTEEREIRKKFEKRSVGL